MKSKRPVNKGGRPEGLDIDPDLLQAIKTYPGYSTDPFSESDPTKYKEAGMREVVNMLSAKIQDYVTRNPHSEVANLVRPKFSGEFQDYQRGAIARELLETKTLKRCFSTGTASQSTINILRAFKLVWDEENEREKQHDKEFARITGMYLVYSTHSTKPGSFQVSLIKIGKDDILHKYKSTLYDATERKLSSEIISNTTLLLKQQEDKFILFFYVFIGAINQPPFLQAVYFFPNRFGNTAANLALFARIRTMSEKEEQAFYRKFDPQRELSEIPDYTEFLDVDHDRVEQDPMLSIRQNIQYFLLHQARPILTKVHDNIIPFDFSKSVAVEPGPDGQRALFYHRTREFVGDYYIYFTERYKSSPENAEESFEKNPFFSTVGRGVFKIFLDEKSGVLKCSMVTRKNVSGEKIKHEGFVFNARLGMADALLMTLFTGSNNERCITITVRIIDDDKMIGGHVIAYAPPGKLGAGTVILVNRELIDSRSSVDDDYPSSSPVSGLDEPTAFIPFDAGPKKGLERNIVNFISDRRNGLVIPPEYEDLQKLGADNRYAGRYRIFSRRKDGGLSVNLLTIYRNGFVRREGKDDKAIGQVEQFGKILNITLKSEKTGRNGFFCIRVDEQPRADGETFYFGVFAGVSRRSGEFPITSKFIMQFLGSEQSFQRQPETFRQHTWRAHIIEADSSDMDHLPDPVKKFSKDKEMSWLGFSQKEDK